jgi:hypothetical protein
MKRSVLTVFAAGTLLVAAACGSDDDQNDMQMVDEVHTPAPVMPMDTMMMDTMMMDTMMMDTMMVDTMPAAQ